MGRLFRATAGAGPRELPQVRLHDVLYTARYDLPENVAPYRAADLDHLFDTFPRNKWFTLREPGDEPGRHGEIQADPRSRAMSINHYLADRLNAWRTNVRGQVWVFEDLMLHATFSIPTPNSELLAADLKAAKAEGIDGYVFESYLQGWNSFASDLWIMARLCCNTPVDPLELQRQYFKALLAGEADKILGFYNRFRGRYLAEARRDKGPALYWIHTAPGAARDYIQTIRSIDEASLPGTGRTWLRDQSKVAGFMEEVLRRRHDPPTQDVLGTQRREDVLALCENALATGRSMDGVQLANGSLWWLFVREYGLAPRARRPALPASFDPEVRSLFSRGLYDIVAKWSAAGTFPKNESDPDAYLRDLLLLAIKRERKNRL